MAQKNIQIQKQEQKLQQRLTPQQILQVQLLEKSLVELEQDIKDELEENPTLTTEKTEGQELEEPADNDPDAAEDLSADDFLQEERTDALNDVLARIGSDDEMPEPAAKLLSAQNADYEERVYGNQKSFNDTLTEQVGEVELTDKQRQIMEYLIGSLDNNGILTKSLDTIGEELAVYQYVDTTQEELEEVLQKLQTFDPAGVGARSVQECLLIQIDRRPDTYLKKFMRQVIANHYDDFLNKRRNVIMRELNLTDEACNLVWSELKKLNPKPGAALGETEGRSLQQITPDFVVETDDNGSVSFYVNNGHLPQLYISAEYYSLLQNYQKRKDNLSRSERVGFADLRERIDRAKGFIDAVKQRQHTLSVTMRAIIDLQRKFFQEGDESDLRPMVLKDVAKKTGLDLSTISRVCNSKYVQTNWGVFRLKFFFSEGIKTQSGETQSSRKFKVLLQDLVNKEDKNKPLSDDELAALMKEKGYPLARRTIAKYREQLGIPVARLRKR